MGVEVQYAPVAQNDVESAPIQNTLTEDELFLVRRGCRWVFFLCFIQFLLAILTLLSGGFIAMVIAALFISFGIVGAAKQKKRLLIAHLIYSFVLYILCLVALVLLGLYCNCPIWVFAIGFFVLLFQAIGMKHSRVMITILKNKGIEGPIPGVLRCCRRRQQQIETAQPFIQTVSQPINAPIDPQITYYAIPAHQLVQMQRMGMTPQFFPLQPVQYPIAQPVQLNQQF